MAAAPRVPPVPVAPPADQQPEYGGHEPQYLHALPWPPMSRRVLWSVLTVVLIALILWWVLAVLGALPTGPDELGHGTGVSETNRTTTRA